MKRQVLVRHVLFRHVLFRHVLIYGIIGGVLIALMQWTEYRFVVIEHSIEIYGGLIAAMFAGLGIWLGLKLTRRGRRLWSGS